MGLLGLVEVCSPDGEPVDGLGSAQAEAGSMRGLGCEHYPFARFGWGGRRGLVSGGGGS